MYIRQIIKTNFTFFWSIWDFAKKQLAILKNTLHSSSLNVLPSPNVWEIKRNIKTSTVLTNLFHSVLLIILIFVELLLGFGNVFSGVLTLFYFSFFLFLSSLTLCTFTDSLSLSLWDFSLLCLLCPVRPVASVSRRNFSLKATRSLKTTPTRRETAIFQLRNRCSPVQASPRGEGCACFDFGNVNGGARALAPEESRGSAVKLCDVSGGELMVVYGRGRGCLWWPELRLAIREGGGILVNLSHGMADLVSYGNADRDIEQVSLLFSVSLC